MSKRGDAANQYLFKSGLYRRRQRCHLFSHEILCERLYRRAGPRIERKRAKLQAKVLAPAATESEFAKRSLDVDQFEYEGTIKKYHTSKEMAACLLELYDSSKQLVSLMGRHLILN